MNQEKIGKYILLKRKNLNLTQKDLGDELGVSDKSVSKWERGVCLPDISLFDKLCNVLKISITELLKGEDIEDDRKMFEVKNELKKTYKFKLNIFKVAMFLPYIIIFIGILLFLISNIVNGPHEYFYARYNIYHVLSISGFILIMYQSRSTILNKFIKTILFMFIYFVLTSLILILNFYIFINPTNKKDLTVYFESVISVKYQDKNLDTVIEEGDLKHYVDKKLVYRIDYDIGLPFINIFFKSYDDNNNLILKHYGNDDYISFYKILEKKLKKDYGYILASENYSNDINDKVYLRIYGYCNNKFSKLCMDEIIFETDNSYVLYSNNMKDFYKLYQKSSYKNKESIINELIKYYDSKYNGDLYFIDDMKNKSEYVYDKDFNLISKRNY